MFADRAKVGLIGQKEVRHLLVYSSGTAYYNGEIWPLPLVWFRRLGSQPRNVSSNLAEATNYIAGGRSGLLSGLINRQSKFDSWPCNQALFFLMRDLKKKDVS